MYFLIGLGIIVIIVYGNMLYDRIKTKKNKDTTHRETAERFKFAKLQKLLKKVLDNLSRK